MGAYTKFSERLGGLIFERAYIREGLYSRGARRDTRLYSMTSEVPTCMKSLMNSMGVT